MQLLKISPSILASDFGRLSDEARRAEDSGADLLHLDVMDGHFVPNLTFGPQVVAAVKKAVKIPLDVHLMISRPDLYAEAFINAGADYLTVHAEAEHNLSQTMKLIRSKGIKTGPALNPDKPLDLIRNVLEESDIVLIMSVFPGFGGQSFMPEVLTKIQELSLLKKQKGYHYEIEIDGGINAQTVVLAKKAGVEIAVAGTALFGAKDMRSAIQQMKDI